MEVRVLGPLELSADDGAVPLGGGKQQVLVAMLTLRAPHYVPRDTLVDALWPETPPPSARHAIESYVSRARRVLRGGADHDGGLTIDSGPGGYRLEAGADQIDGLRFEALARDGHDALAAGDLPEAARSLGEALDLWRGPALGALADHPALRADAAGLEERRLHVLESWAEAELALGRHRQLSPVLRAECARRPGRERLHELLMLARYRSGDQADALAVYGQVRRHLSHELGLEPGPTLRELQRQVLQHDPALTAPGTVALSAAGPATRSTAATGTSPGGRPAADRGQAEDTSPAQGPSVATRLPLPEVMATAWRSRLVGRDAPLSTLESALSRATGGELQTVVLGGEPGIGKTRLSSELAQRAHAAGALVLFGRCDEEPLLPHQPFVEGLRQYIAGADPAVLTAQLGPGGGELLRILPELAARVPTLPVPVEGDPEGARFRLFEAVGGLLASVCREQPVVFVLDDLHWADRPTLLLLRYLTRSLPTSPLLVLGTYRETEVDAGHPFAATLAELRTTTGFTAVGLQRLGEADVDRLVADHRAGSGRGPVAGSGEVVLTIDDGVPAGRSGHKIYEETDGNPFFVVEMLSHLEETGGAGLGLGVPEGVKDVIARRLARLDTDANRALAIASIVGRDFHLAVLDGMSDLGEDRLADVLETAAQAHVIEEVAGAVGHFTFSHALTRETVYGMLTNTRRALLHRRAAVTIEARHADELGPHRAELAHHFECAGAPEDLSRATEHRAAAGQRDLALLAYEQAANHFRRAAALIEQLGVEGREAQRCDLVIAQGEAERQSGDAAYRETLLEGARLAGENDDAARLAQAVLANNRELFSSAQGVDEERVAALRAALAAQPEADSAVRAELLALLAVEQLAGPDWEGRRALADDAVAMARRVGDRRTLGAVVQRRYVALWGPKTVAQRLADAEETAAIGAELGDPMLAFAGAALGSIVAMEAGDPVRADELLDRVAPLVRQLGQPVLRWYEVVCHAKRTTMNGHPLDAERLAREAFEVGQEAGQPDVVAWFFLQTVAARFAGARLGADDPDLPLLFSMPGLSLPVSPEYTQSASVGLQMEATKALTFSELGRFDDARRHLDVAMANGLRDLSHDFAALSMPAFAAVAAWHLGDRENAALLHRVIEPHRAQFVDSGAMWLGAAPHYLARLEVVLGRHEDADGSFAAAADRYAALDADAWLARLKIDWAGALLGRGDAGSAGRGAELAADGLSIAQRLDLPGLVERATLLSG